MRIIRDASAEIEQTIICKKCGCEMGYVPADIQESSTVDYSGGSDTTRWIVCPKCGARIHV